VKVAEEFFEWAFSSAEARHQREQTEQANRLAIQQEVERIERTLCLVKGEAPQVEDSLVMDRDLLQREIEMNTLRISEISSLLGRSSFQL
jgi:hypothetical protein